MTRFASTSGGMFSVLALQMYKQGGYVGGAIFDEAAQLEVVNHFWDAMAPKSYLYIGHSESLFGLNTKFEFLKKDWACLYQKNI